MRRNVSAIWTGSTCIQGNDFKMDHFATVAVHETYVIARYSTWLLDLIHVLIAIIIFSVLLKCYYDQILTLDFLA